MSPSVLMTDTDAESAVLAAADELFYEHGIVNVSMAQIRDGSGVSMRRLYALCPSKADLVTRWLDHRHGTWMSDFHRRIDEHQAGAEIDASPIDSIFAALTGWMVETDFRGCAFINTLAETSELTNDNRRSIRTHKKAFADYLDSVVPAGSAVAVVIDGAIVQASIFSSTEPLERAHSVATILVNQELS